MGGRKSPSARRRRALGRNRSQRQGGLLVARQTNNGTQHGSGEHGVRAFVFPGQGSQSVGMGKALAEASAAAREVFQEVDDALGQNRSEEHTSELQSLMRISYAVFRLKKKTQ